MKNYIRNAIIILILLILVLVVLGFINIWLMIGVILGGLVGLFLGTVLTTNLSSKIISDILTTANLDTSLGREALKTLNAKKGEDFLTIRKKYKNVLFNLDNTEGLTELELHERHQEIDAVHKAYNLICNLQNWEEYNVQIEEAEKQEAARQKKEKEEEEIIAAYHALKEQSPEQVADVDKMRSGLMK